MSELERVGRLPVFVDEDQWARAFQAARQQVEVLYAQGVVDVPSGNVACTLRRIAVAIASAAVRAAAQDDTGDIEDVPGVTVDEIGSYTTTPSQGTPPTVAL